MPSAASPRCKMTVAVASPRTSSTRLPPCCTVRPAGASAARQNSIDVAHSCISTLNRHRSSRVALLTSGFPPIHYAILAFLGAGICTAFLIETNVKALQLLNLSQLQLLFAMLVGVCSANGALCFDLADPFRGSFSITSAARQLTALTATLEADLFRAKKEVLSSTVGSSSLSLERGSGRGALGGRETFLFHLFTSPVAAQARAVGDIWAVGWHASLSAWKAVPRPWRHLRREPGQMAASEVPKLVLQAATSSPATAVAIDIAKSNATRARM